MFLHLLSSDLTDYLICVNIRLNYLAPYVLPDFFDSKEQNLTSIWAGKIENLSQRFNMAIPRLTAMALLRYLWPDYTQLTKLGFQNFSQQLDANYLKVAPWQLWKFNVNTLETSDVINKGLLQKLAIDRSAGSLTDGQVYKRSDFQFFCLNFKCVVLLEKCNTDPSVERYGDKTFS